MKTLKLMLRFFTKNPFLLIFVLLEMTLSLFLFVDQLGVLQYQTYTYDTYKNSDLCLYDHFAPDFVSGLSEDPNSTENSLLENLYDIEAIKDVGEISNITSCYEDDYKKDPINTHKRELALLTPSFFDSLPIDLAEGSWFDETRGNESEITAIASGETMRDYRVGDTVSVLILDSYNYNTPVATVNIRIIGKLSEPAFFPALNTSGSSLPASLMFSSKGGFIVSPTQENYDLLSSYIKYGSTQRCKLIRYSDGLSESELEQARAELRKWGTLTTPEEIDKDSRDDIAREMRKRFPMVLFFIIISSFSMISSVIITQMKMQRNNSVYYLCGATPSKCYFLYSGVPITFIGLFAVGINILRIAYIRLNGLDIGYQNTKKILNGTTVLILLIYFAVTVSIAILTSYYVFKRNTPAENYRKNK